MKNYISTNTGIMNPVYKDTESNPYISKSIFYLRKWERMVNNE